MLLKCWVHYFPMRRLDEKYRHNVIHSTRQGLMYLKCENCVKQHYYIKTTTCEASPLKVHNKVLVTSHDTQTTDKQYDLI